MNRPAHQPPLMSLDDFEELLADAPDDERWELISGRVVRMMVGARWEHNQIITNLNVALVNRFRANGSPCRTLVESFRDAEQARAVVTPARLDRVLSPAGARSDRDE